MKLRLIASVMLLCISISPLIAQNEMLLPGEVRQWKVPVREGLIVASLSSYPDGDHPRNIISLYPLYPLKKRATANVNEQVNAINMVLNDMTSLGYRTEDLERITINLEAIDFQEQLNRQVAASGKWRACVGDKYCWEIEDVIIGFLRSNNTYKPLQDLLHAKGLRIGKMLMEDPAVRTVPSPNSSPRHNTTGESTKVLCGGLILLEVEREK